MPFINGTSYRQIEAGSIAGAASWHVPSSEGLGCRLHIREWQSSKYTAPWPAPCPGMGDRQFLGVTLHQHVLKCQAAYGGGELGLLIVRLTATGASTALQRFSEDPTKPLSCGRRLRNGFPIEFDGKTMARAWLYMIYDGLLIQPSLFRIGSPMGVRLERMA
ncbi:hypothetical protein BDV93DRAFT_508523 [Ceratobasidium sp. AG-I]|nr:hypothetical protein BDV93DRAFT_508523 [Ceratobasidium sp. AG-I]